MVTSGHINRTPHLVSVVAKRLRNEIRTNHAIGDKLPTEVALAERFQISRTVIREAVATLRSEGLLETRQGSGIYVARTQVEPVFRLTRVATREKHLRSVYELRFGLEVASSGLAAVHRSAADIRVLGQALKAMAQRENRATADLDFHTGIARATRNEHYKALIVLLTKELGGLIGEANSGAQDYEVPPVAMLVEEHQYIYDAIVDADPEAARRAMVRHLSKSAKRFGVEIRGFGINEVTKQPSGRHSSSSEDNL